MEKGKFAGFCTCKSLLAFIHDKKSNVYLRTSCAFWIFV